MESLSFFINEIIESDRVRDKMIECKALSASAKDFAEKIKRGEISEPEGGVFELFVFGHLADFAMAKFEAMKIPRSVAVATLKDINFWIENHESITGEIGVSEFSWLILHYTASLFRIGRLQFRLVKPTFSVETQKPFVVETHIPQGEPLSEEACLESFDLAEAFFAEHFPALEWDVFVCDSWLLSPNLSDILPESSNIVRFMRLWTPAPFPSDDSAQAIERVFGFGAKREELEALPEKTTLAKNLKAYILSGGEINISGGYRRRTNV